MKDLSTDEGRIEAAKCAGRNLAAYDARCGYAEPRDMDNMTVWSHLAAVGFTRLGTRMNSIPFADAYNAEFIRLRLEYIRGEIEAERVSTGELIELQGLADHIDKGDVLLLQWAGVPEHDDVDKVWTREELDAVINKWFPERLGTFYLEGSNELAAIETMDGKMWRVWADGDTQDYNP